MQSDIVSSRLDVLTKASIGMFMVFTMATGAEYYFGAKSRDEARLLLSAHRAIDDVAADIHYFNLQTSNAIAGDVDALNRLSMLAPLIERETAEAINTYGAVLGKNGPANLNALVRDITALKLSIEQTRVSPRDGSSPESVLCPGRSCWTILGN